MLLINQKRHETNLDYKKESIFVWGGGDCDTLINYLNFIRSFVNKDMCIKITDALQVALDNCSPQSLVLLPSGWHMMKALGGLQMGGVIKGMCIFYLQYFG